MTAQISICDANLSLTNWNDWIGVNRMAETIIVQRAFRYRIYPSHAQQTKLNNTLALCAELYNAALQERRDAYTIAHKAIHYKDQQNQLPEIKALRPELNTVHSQVLQDVLRRLDKAFDAFFRRVREQKGKAGYPRFRSRFRYNSFTYPQSGFSIENSKLRLSKIGKVKIKLHREIEGTIKGLTIVGSATGKWYACFQVEQVINPEPHQGETVGIDVGIKTFATLSDGTEIENPKFFRAEEKEPAKAQRKLAKQKKGPKEYKKQRKVVARIHERITNKRNNFTHQLSYYFAATYALIVFEKLNICGMVKNHCLAKSISDASWNQLVQFTTYKAEGAGGRVVQVNARNTSKMCSACGELIEKDLSVRVHDCPGCGLIIDRDHNAALNILAMGLHSVGLTSHRSRFLQGAE